MKISRFCSWFSEILHVLLDLTNLGEQLAVYFIVKQANQSENDQRTFFFIILSIGFVSCIISGIKKPLLATSLSILVEIGELLAYLFALPRSTTLTIVVLLLSCIEIFLHVTMLIITCCTEESENSSINTSKNTGACLSIIYHALFYVIYNVPSLLYLFLNEDSSFRETFYEILILLDAYVSSIAIGIFGEILPTRWQKRGWKPLPPCSILLVWYIILKITGTLLFSFCIPISGWTLAVLEIKKRVNNNTLQLDYDSIIYCLSLLLFIPIMVVNWYLLYHTCFGIRNHFCVKVDPYLSKKPSPEDDDQ